MKKLISIALSVIMLISVGAVSAIPAMAGVSSPGQSEVTTKPLSEREPVIITVNSNKSDEVSYTKDNYKYTFVYSGDSEVTGWEFPGMIEDTDYYILSMSADKTKVVIELTESGINKQVKANALVKDAASESEEEEVTDDDNSGTSPATGAAMAGIAIAGAGVAMLAVSKRKND